MILPKHHLSHTPIAPLILALFTFALITGCTQQAKVDPAPTVTKTKYDKLLERVAADKPLTAEEIIDTLENNRDPWQAWGEDDFPVYPAEKYLKDWVIVLDPGHGGDAHKKNWKRGPTGVREAEINLRVGLILKTLLEHAGAQVQLTRDDDSYDMGLAARAEVANTIVRHDGGTGADLFVSLHHNASGPTANYSTVWFHGPVKWSEPDLDPAKYVAHRLGAALRTQVGKTSPLMNDQQMYKDGFGVLKQTTVPAFLCESTFHTNPDEEQRLRDAEYNLREAYAIYMGLAEYAYGGRPTQSAPVIKKVGSDFIVTTKLDDGSDKGWWGHDKERTIASSINLSIDGVNLQTSYNPETKELVGKITEAELPLAEKPRELWINHINMFKHSNYPQRYNFKQEATTTDKGAAAKPLPVKRNGLDN
ncbi:N-acetylmuramoyl-L-alanine amidase family protein [Poriferisphaera sp. WC338]|uniref:N-acetylmuramoyl-L-alanine amidase family protein n=1 Tax=Poriferisphaera sp. WC338 TaxID=3425129 RepID=UPI003D817E7B